MNGEDMLFTGGIETFFTVPEQLLLFLCSVMAGAVLGAVYDIFRAIRITLPFMRRKLPTALSDMLYMLIFGAAVFLLSAYIGRGQVRFFYCLGAALGALLYIVTAGNAAVSVLKKLCEFIARGFGKICGKLRRAGSTRKKAACAPSDEQQ